MLRAAAAAGAMAEEGAVNERDELWLLVTIVGRRRVPQAFVCMDDIVPNETEIAERLTRAGLLRRVSKDPGAYKETAAGIEMVDGLSETLLRAMGDK